MFEYAESNSNAYMQWAARQVKWKCKVEGHEETISDLSGFALDPGTLRTGWGKITNADAQEVWGSTPLVSTLLRVDGDAWTNWTPDAAASDADYIAGLALAQLGLEKDDTVVAADSE